MTDDHVTHPAVDTGRRSIAVGTRPLALVVAPYGFGKTVFARELAETWERPLVWVDIRDGDSAPDAAVAAALSAHCETRIETAPFGHASDCEVTVVVDDLDRAEFAAAQTLLQDTVSAFSARHSRPVMRAVICLRDRRLLQGFDLVKPVASGHLVVIGPEDLRLTPEDLERAHGHVAARLFEMHAGWPLGTDLAARGERAVTEVDLWRSVLRAAPDDVVRILGGVAGPRPLPVAAAIRGLGTETADRLADWTWRLSPAFCTRSEIEGAETITFSASALDAIAMTGTFALDDETTLAIAAECDRLGHVDTALHLLVAAGMAAAAAELVERRAIGALESGQPATLARWIETLPEGALTPVLDLALASASVLRGLPSDIDLISLMEEVWTASPHMGPWAACIVVWNMLAQGDPGLLPIATDALARIFGSAPEPGRTADDLTALDPETAVWATRIVIAQAILLLVSGFPAARERAHTLMAGIDTALRRHSLGTERLRGLFTVLDYYVGGREPHDADIVALPYIRAMDAPLGVWPVLILTWHLLRCGDVTAGRVALDELDAWLRTYPEMAGATEWPALCAAGMRAAFRIIDPGCAREDVRQTAEGLEGLWHELLRSPTVDLTTIATLFGIACVDAELTDHARRWRRRAESGFARLPSTAADIRALGGRLTIRQGDVDAGLETLDQVIAEHRDADRIGAVAVLHRWVLRDLVAVGHSERALARYESCADELPGEWRDALKDEIPTASEGSPPSRAQRRSGSTVPVVSGSALRSAASNQFVLIAAPYGYGKHDLAGILASEWGGDVLRMRAAELTTASVTRLQSLSSRTCVVIEDLHAGTRTRAGIAELAASAHPDVRYVLTSTSVSDRTLLDSPELLGSGRVCVLLPEDLRIRPGDLVDLLEPDEVLQVLTATGGWPLATRFAVSDVSGTDPARLFAAVLNAAPPEVRQAVHILAPLSPVPVGILRACLDEASLEELAMWTWDLSPMVAQRSGDTVRLVTPEASEPDLEYARQAVRRLEAADHVTQAIEVAVNAGLDGEAGKLITSNIRRLVDSEGRAQSVRRWLARIHAETDDPALTLARAAADIFSESSSGTDMVDLVEDTSARAPELALRAAGLTGWKLLHTWDPRFLNVITTVFARTYGGPLTPRPLSAWLQTLDTPRFRDATDALMLLVITSLHTLQPSSRATAQVVFDVTERALRQRDLPAEHFTALYTAHDCMSGGRVLDDEVCDLILRSARTTDHVVTPWTAVATAQTALRSGDGTLASRAIDLLDEWLVSNPELAGHTEFTPSFLRRVLDHAVRVGSCSDDHDRLREDGERLWQAGLSHDASRAAGTAVFVAGRWLDAGQVDLADTWLRRSTQRKSGLPVHADGHTLLRARIAARSGNVMRAREHLDALVERRTATGHDGIVEVARRRVIEDLTAAGEHAAARDLLDSGRNGMAETWAGPLPHPDMAGAAAPRPNPRATSGSSARLVLLAPEVELVTPEGEARPLSGQAARLLAALVASDGHLEIDRAVDLLFPDLDLENGRKRLHSTMYRTRRGLGPHLSHLLTLEGDVVRLKSDPGLEIDVWNFSTAMTDGRLGDAVDSYHEHFCSRQFAYEDFAIDERRILRNRFTHAAVTILTERLRTGATGRDAELARTCCALVPDDEALARAAIAVLRSLGSAREARELADSAAARMEGFGPSAEDLFGA